MPLPAVAPEVIVDRDVTVVGLGPGCQMLDEVVLDGGLRDQLLEIASDANPPRVVLDLTQTTFFGSSFIELLFRMRNRLQSKPRGGFAICGVAPYCQEVLKVAHLDTLWRLFPTRESAIAAFTSGAE
jgi:anti-anti-sigma regulatory factor